MDFSFDFFSFIPAPSKIRTSHGELCMTSAVTPVDYRLVLTTVMNEEYWFISIIESSVRFVLRSNKSMFTLRISITNVNQV